MHRVVISLFAAGMLVACGSAFTAAGSGDGGAEGGASDASAADAVTPGDAGSSDAPAIVDAVSDVRDEGGLLCPGADIFHPSSTPRSVNTSVPFVGGARDPSCTRILGPKLVWTDSLEGTIGTGETFNYTFTMTGSHTVTLTATDGQGRKYIATLVLPIN